MCKQEVSGETVVGKFTDNGWALSCEPKVISIVNTVLLRTMCACVHACAYVVMSVDLFIPLHALAFCLASTITSASLLISVIGKWYIHSSK